MQQAVSRGDSADRRLLDEFDALQREALSANPLLDFDRLLIVKRKDSAADSKYFKGLGLPQNWQGNCSLPRKGLRQRDRRAVVRARRQADHALQPAERRSAWATWICNFDADRMLFSMRRGKDRRWQIFEMKADGTGLRQVTPGEARRRQLRRLLPARRRIIFASTRCASRACPASAAATAWPTCTCMDADGTNVRAALLRPGPQLVSRPC